MINNISLIELDIWAAGLLKFLISFLWQSSIVILIVSIATLLLRKHSPQIRHKLWLFSALVIPAIPLFTWIMEKIRFPRNELAILPSYETFIYSKDLTEQSQQINNNAVIDISNLFGTSSTGQIYPMLTIVTIIGLVTLALATILFINLGRLKIFIRDSRPVKDQMILEIFSEIQTKLKISKRVKILESYSAETALTTGTLNPIVILPTDILKNISQSELYSIVIHELAHIKRKDSIALLYSSFIRALFFYHPLIWIITDQIAQLAEQSCDEMVLKMKKDHIGYAKTLANFAEIAQNLNTPLSLAHGLLYHRYKFRTRIEAILHWSKFPMKKVTPLTRIGVLSIVISAWIFAISIPIGNRATAAEKARNTWSIAAEKSDSLKVSFILPVEIAVISSEFGKRKNPYSGEMDFHEGIDLKGKNGDKVFASADGIISQIQKDKNNGRYIIIDHGSTFTTKYSHLSEWKVKEGDKVKAGDLIGIMGESGLATGPHLHFAIYSETLDDNGLAARAIHDPKRFIDFE
jgi:beta-lactamase regulating signal transducer with metallopeptidase domain